MIYTENESEEESIEYRHWDDTDGWTFRSY